MSPECSETLVETSWGPIRPRRRFCRPICRVAKFCDQSVRRRQRCRGSLEDCRRDNVLDDCVRIAKHPAAGIRVGLTRRVVTLVSIPAVCARLAMQLYDAHSMIGHRTSEAAQRPGCKCEQDAAASDATDGFGATRARGGHGWIIRVGRCCVNDLTARLGGWKRLTSVFVASDTISIAPWISRA